MVVSFLLLNMRLLELNSVTFDILHWKVVFHRGYAKAGFLTGVRQSQEDPWDGFRGVCGPHTCVYVVFVHFPEGSQEMFQRDP